MNLTNEQKKELLLKYIDPAKDFVKASNGKILVSVDASKRIAAAFKLNIPDNGQFEPTPICNYIIQREQQRLAAQASMMRVKEAKMAEEAAKLNQVINCIKSAKEDDKNDFEVAVEIEAACSDLKLSEIMKGIDKAIADGILPESNLVKNNYKLLKNRSAATKRFASVSASIKNPSNLVEALSSDMLEYYTKDALSLGHIHLALLDAGIDENLIYAALDSFYVKYEQKFVEKYAKLDMPMDQLLNEIYKKYIQDDVFDSRIIVSYLEKLNKENINTDDIAYRLYQLEGDEKEVYKIMMLQNITVKERVEKLKDLDLQYPVECLKRTFAVLSQAYELPYDEILSEYLKEEQLEETEVEELQAVDGVVFPLNEDGDSFVENHYVAPDGSYWTSEAEYLEFRANVDAAFAVEEEEEYEPRRLKIVKKEKEVKAIEKKKTLATLLIGAGFVPVAVLALVFKVDPIVASKNCVTALSQLANGSMGLSGILPSATQMTALLAGMGTTFVGFVKYLKNKVKLKRSKEELVELTEEDIDELTEEEETTKKGRR